MGGGKNRVVLFLGFMGLSIALLAGLSEQIAWLNALCAVFSDGCRETARFTLFKVPLWGWGVAYFSALLLSALRAHEWLAWLIPAAVGVEIALVWIMFSLKVLCVYCLGNLLVVALLIVFSFQRCRFWQTSALCLFFFLFSFFVIPYENELHASVPFVAPIPVKEEKAPPVARIGDRTVSDEELTLGALPRIRELEQEIYRLKRQRLEQIVTETILDKEAGERGVPVDQFVNGEILAQPAKVEESEIDRYIQDNQSRLPDWKGTMDELRDRVRTYLQKQKNFERVVQYAKSLEPKYGVEIYLKEPESLAAKLSNEGSPTIGPADAPVTIYEFSDYQCPACRQGHEAVRKTREMFSGQIRWVYKNFPLKMHKDAPRAAEAGLCSGDQNKFWEYQDLLYASKEDLPPERLAQFAKELGLDGDQFQQCLESGKYKGQVQKDIEDAKKAGVDRTPTFIINGRMVTGGIPVEQFKAMIDEEMKKVKEKK